MRGRREVILKVNKFSYCIRKLYEHAEELGSNDFRLIDCEIVDIVKPRPRVIAAAL